MSQCIARRKDFERCTNNAERGSVFCRRHRRWWIITLFGTIVGVTTLGANIAQMFGVTFPLPFGQPAAPNPSLALITTHTPVASLTSIVTLTHEPFLTETNTPPPTLITNLTCTENILSHSWHLEATADADEAAKDFSDRYILQSKDIVRVTYNLHGLIAQEGTGKNDSAIVFNQPNWYGASLANYGTNGFDGEQTVDIPISAFLELPNLGQNIVGGRQLNLNEPVPSIRARFWHQDHFTVDITAIYLCSLP